MLDSDLTDDDVQQVIADLTGEDPELGRLAAGAWMSLTAGEGPAMLSLAGLQNWVWWLLPKRSYAHDDEHHEYWVASAAATGVLFDRLEAPSYAATCRSEATTRVLGAWRQSRSKGLAATRKALKASPVTPPDPDDFVWGDVFGIWENNAQNAVEVALEQAIVDRRLDPTKPRWRRVAAEICTATLDEGRPGDIGQSWRSLVLSERADTWATGPRTPPHRRAERQDVAAGFMSPPPLPDDEVTAGPLGLLGWLAEACADGVKLTASGYLPRALVLDAVETHDWWDWKTPPRSEADVYELAMVHNAARRLGVLRRKGRTLTTTKAGHDVTTQPALWWPRLVMLGHNEVPYRDTVFEAMILEIIDGAEHDVDDLGTAIGGELAAEGWQTDGEPTTAEQHARSLYMAINPWRFWGFIDYRSSRWEPTPDGPRRVTPTTVTATPAGRAAGALWLHRHITGPRRDI